MSPLTTLEIAYILLFLTHNSFFTSLFFYFRGGNEMKIEGLHKLKILKTNRVKVKNSLVKKLTKIMTKIKQFLDLDVNIRIEGATDEIIILFIELNSKNPPLIVQRLIDMFCVEDFEYLNYSPEWLIVKVPISSLIST